jgi:hypothetical protein
VFNNDHNTNRVFMEGALMTAYAWNSAPVATTDLSRSLIVLGRECHFSIDFTSRKDITFDVEKAGIQSYTSSMFELLEKCQTVFKMLIQEHLAYYCELCKSQINSPRKFKVGDIVFARVQVQRIATKGHDISFALLLSDV